MKIHDVEQAFWDYEKSRDPGETVSAFSFFMAGAAWQKSLAPASDDSTQGLPLPQTAGEGSQQGQTEAAGGRVTDRHNARVGPSDLGPPLTVAQDADAWAVCKTPGCGGRFHLRDSPYAMCPDCRDRVAAQNECAGCQHPQGYHRKDAGPCIECGCMRYAQQGDTSGA